MCQISKSIHTKKKKKKVLLIIHTQRLFSGGGGQIGSLMMPARLGFLDEQIMFQIIHVSE